MSRLFLCGLSGVLWLAGSVCAAPPEPAAIDIGSRRELLVDYYLIDTLRDVRLVLHPPRDEGIVVRFDQPWEGPFCGYCTVIHDGSTYRLYYRGLPTAGRDGSPAESCCYAESARWRALDETVARACLKWGARRRTTWCWPMPHR